MSKGRTTRVAFEPGEIRALLMPWSEVCMHMGIQNQVYYGELREVMVSKSYLKLYSVQLYKEPMEKRGQPYTKQDLIPFSIPITYGEAGVYRTDEGFYYYPPEQNPLRYDLVPQE